MSSKIKILSEHVINRIAAGEVVERPASVVKELIENSIDAGATDIAIEIEQAGRRLIRIVDNGSGMSREDAQVAFERHATSKIRTDADLEHVRSMGFRGEALSSIASVSHIRLITAEQGAQAGVIIELEGGIVKAISDIAAPKGTSLEVNHLFFNTPAREKFLKSTATEFAHLVNAVSRQAMAHPSIKFKVTHNQKIVLDLPASQSIRERALQIYGRDITDNLFEFSGSRDSVVIRGLLSTPGTTRADKTYQDFYVNERAVKNASLSHALYSAYGDMLMRDRHPLGFIFIEMDPALVDVNVHPAKAEVRFRNQSQIHDAVRDILREALRNAGMPTASAHADRIKEAVADYVANTDYGIQHAQYRNLNPYSNSPRQLEQAFPVTNSLTIPQDDAALIPQIESLYPLTQIHDSYIVAQSSEGMALVDQHAAHERVLFEKLQDQYGHKDTPVQNLLIPVQVELGPAEANLLVECLPQLAEIGLGVEDFGNGTFIIKTIPVLLAGADYKKLLLDIIDELFAHGKSSKMDGIRDDILSVMACHPAIKVHRRLSAQEMQKLLHDLFQCRMPHTCPHGRPTIVRFSLEEIEKMFKRI